MMNIGHILYEDASCKAYVYMYILQNVSSMKLEVLYAKYVEQNKSVLCSQLLYVLPKVSHIKLFDKVQ